LDEQELVLGLRERRESAVATFLERYRSLLYHCIGHFETDPTTREDLYQELVVYVLDRLDKGTFDPNKGSFGTWLYRVAWCRCVDLKRKQGAQRAVRFATTGEELSEREDRQPGPSEQLADSEIGSLVRDALTSLEAEDQSLLSLRFMEGATLGEIAQRLSISLEQTKYRLRRATVSMRRVLVSQIAVEETLE